ncbi:cold-shock protein [Algoriphagus aestuariicola]|jgi:S-adenosylmethionine hydrolase|uniref:Cold-shock protein n=1 Tax=Algoriphagus aestuariicola TaxID=1852016 RepID=A0ABS3BLW5_9BACT|nr:cold-shock protein [Algoriphagus aestuariicola]MBN7800293.1 cold-shock protein [Algoriphagus aestuariicola]
MSKNQNTFIKKQKAELKKRKQKEKLEKKLERKAQPKDGSLDNMIAYIDEFGNISDTPPAPPIEKKTNSNQSNQNRVKTNQNFRNHE